MRYCRCKCGEQEAWSSLHIHSCQGCEKCKTSLAESPNAHVEVQPHDFEQYFTVDHRTGKTSEWRKCRRCGYIERNALAERGDKGEATR